MILKSNFFLRSEIPIEIIFKIIEVINYIYEFRELQDSYQDINKIYTKSSVFISGYIYYEIFLNKKKFNLIIDL